MIDIQQNSENILPYRPNWSEDEKTAYVDKLKYINENYDKLLAIHHALISNSLRTFDYLTDATAEFIASYLRGKIKNEKFEAIGEIKEDLREIKEILKKLQENIELLENNI